MPAPFDWQARTPCPNAPNPMTADYLAGFAKGYDDAQLIAEPAHNGLLNPHTYPEYCRVSDTYWNAIHPFPAAPTDHQRGYGDGMDAYALEVMPAEGWPERD